MPSDPNSDVEVEKLDGETGNVSLENEFESKMRRRRLVDPELRLSPPSGRSTLFTVLFFSAIVIAILYWLFVQ